MRFAATNLMKSFTSAIVSTMGGLTRASTDVYSDIAAASIKVGEHLTDCRSSDENGCRLLSIIDPFSASDETASDIIQLSFNISDDIAGEGVADITAGTVTAQKTTVKEVVEVAGQKPGANGRAVSLGHIVEIVGEGSVISREVIKADEISPLDHVAAPEVNPHFDRGLESQISVEPHSENVITSANSAFTSEDAIPAFATSPEISGKQPWANFVTAISHTASPSSISNHDSEVDATATRLVVKSEGVGGKEGISKTAEGRAEIAHLARKAKEVYAAHVEVQHTARNPLKTGRKGSPFTNTSVIASIASANNPAQIGTPLTGSPRISVVPSANGINHVVIDGLSSPRFPSARVHLIEHSGGIEFAGIEGGKALGASNARSLPLPVPTFLPNGLIQNRAQTQGAPGRDAPTDTLDSEESVSEFRERLTSFMIEQLKEGPTPTATNRILKQLNAYLSFSPHLNSKRPVTPSMWSQMVRRALSEAIRVVPIFDEKGLRQANSIKYDVAAILGMEPTAFHRWENIFETDLLTDQLSDEHAAPTGESFEADLTGHLLSGLKKRLPSMAKQTLDPDHIDPSIGLEGEANLQWGIAVASSIENSKRKAEEEAEEKAKKSKVEATLGYLKDVMKHNPAAAGKGVALILKHSDIIRSIMYEEPFVPRWEEAEIRSLINSIMTSEIWELMANRSLRKHFDDDPQTNRFLNDAVFEANFTRAEEKLNEIDVTKVSPKEFWKAVEETGLEEIFFNNAIAKMAQYN